MKTLFKYLIYAMIVIAFFNIIYNSVKTFSEIKEWGGLTDSQKRQKIFGDYYTFLLFIQNNTSANDEILIFNKDTDKWKTFFQSVYYLYPRSVRTTIDRNEFNKLIESKQFKYIAAFNNPIYAEGYQEIASFSAKRNTSYGSIYKMNE